MDWKAGAAAEYCLFWIDVWWMCLSKNEWASWVQAVGTLLTLAAAGGVAWYEVHQRRKEAAQQGATSLTARGHLIDLFVMAFDEFLQIAGADGLVQEKQYKRAYHGLLRAIDRVAKIDLIELPTQVSMLHLSAVQHEIANLSPKLKLLEYSRPLPEERQVLEAALGRIQNFQRGVRKEANRLAGL